MNRVCIWLFLLLSISVTVSAQRTAYFKRVFVDAEYYLLYEDYRDALRLYLELNEAFPDNSNVSYRIGLCYLNIPNQKDRAIPFLQEAIKNVTDSYKEGYFTEQKAPKEAFLQYGIALRIGNDFEKAIQAFNTYRSMLKENETQEMVIVKREIEAVYFAQQMIENPANVKFTSTGRYINTRFPEINPVVCSNNKTMIYTSVQQFYNAIMVSTMEGDTWMHPININSQLFADGAIRTVGLSANGRSLLLARNDNDIFNLYISNFDTLKNTWSPIVRLPKEINTRNWENYASFSPTGDTIIFSSNRPTGKGGFDIFMSTKTATGWTEAVNLGDIINTPFDEIAPVVSHDGKKLYFASKGHSTMGGFDIFVSILRNGVWTKPVNLGYPINTTDDDVFYYPVGDGYKGYISRFLPQNFGENDIYLVEYEIASKQNEEINGLKPPVTPITQGKPNPQANLKINGKNSLSNP